VLQKGGEVDGAAAFHMEDPCVPKQGLVLVHMDLLCVIRTPLEDPHGSSLHMDLSEADPPKFFCCSNPRCPKFALQINDTRAFH
jgi:hypothetical protein